MRVSIDTPGMGNIITAYDPGVVTVNDHKITVNSIITPKQVLDWDISTLDGLVEEDLIPLFECEAEIYLIGTGHSHVLRPDFMLHAIRKGVGLEIMATDAACRTYNVLVSEGRNIAAALILTD